MASSLDIAAEIQIYFIQNIASLGLNITQLKIAGMPFDDNSVNEWIELSYQPIYNKLIGFNGTTTGRLNYSGLLNVYCRNEVRMNCFKMADDVSSFLNGKILPLDIRVGIGQHGQILDLESNLFEIKVSFDIEQMA